MEGEADEAVELAIEGDSLFLVGAFVEIGEDGVAQIGAVVGGDEAVLAQEFDASEDGWIGQ